MIRVDRATPVIHDIMRAARAKRGGRRSGRVFDTPEDEGDERVRAVRTSAGALSGLSARNRKESREGHCLVWRMRRTRAFGRSNPIPQPGNASRA
jgi:hypothetical protein